MSSDDPWVLKMQATLAGGQAGDAIASDDPFIRMLLAARQRSQRSDLVSIKDLAAELGVSIRTLRRRNNHPDAPQRVKAGRRHMYRRSDVQAWLERAAGQTTG